MSSSVSPRPLSFIPFLAADAVLLLTAGLIAWRTTDELTGGALLAVVVCTGLGAVLTVLPFVLNDAREREAALAERQRELVELMSSSTASASRWGTQWAAAATGLEDAATLASRSIAAAEQLPAVFQEKVDGLAVKLEQAGRDAEARNEAAAKQDAALTQRAEQIDASTAALGQTLAGFGRVAAEIQEQRASLSALLSEFPAAAARADSARQAMEERVISAPVQIEERLTRIVAESEARLNGTAATLTTRLTEMEPLIAALTIRLQAAAETPVVTPVVVQLEEPTAAEVRLTEVAATLATRLSEVETLVGALTARLQAVAEVPIVAPVVVQPEVAPAPEPVAAAAMVVEAPAPEPMIADVRAVESVAAVAPVVEKTPARSETILDPFVIPDDGYAALAEAMDAGHA